MITIQETMTRFETGINQPNFNPCIKYIYDFLCYFVKETDYGLKNLGILNV